MRDQKIYEEFLKFCDLTTLMDEKDPYQFFCCLDWDFLEKYFKNFLSKMKSFDLNSISFEQAKQISRILF